MVDILICDSDSEIRAFLEAEINFMIESMNLPFNIELITEDSDKVFNYLEHNNNSSIYIIDTLFTCEIDGFQLAKCIRQYDARGYIVFITKEPMKLQEVFDNKIEAIDFIPKDDLVELKSRIMDNLIYILDLHQHRLLM